MLKGHDLVLQGMHVLIMMPLLISEPSVHLVMSSMEGVLHLDLAFMKGSVKSALHLDFTLMKGCPHSLHALLNNSLHLLLESF